MKFSRCLQLIAIFSLLVCVCVESLTMEEAKNNPDCNCTNGKCVCSKVRNRTSSAHRRFYSTVYPGNLDETNGYGNGNFGKFGKEAGNDGLSTKPITTELTTPEPTKPPSTTTTLRPDPEPTEPPPPQPDATTRERWQLPQPPSNNFPNVFVTSWSDNGKTQNFAMSSNGGDHQKMSRRTDGNYPPSPTNIQVKTENNGNGFNSGFSGSWTASGTGGAPGGTNFFGTGVLPSGKNAFTTAFKNGKKSETSNMPGNGQNFGFNNGQNFGFNNGKNFGFNNGQNFGFDNGQNFGFDNGQNFGFNNAQKILKFGLDNAKNFGFNNGQNFGFNNGQNFGLDNGQNFGLNNGQNFGLNNGQNFGFDNEQNSGFDNEQNFGFNNGQNFGFNNGQNFGFNNGFPKATALANSGNQDGGNGSLMPKLFPNFDFGAVQPFDMNFGDNGFEMPMLE